MHDACNELVVGLQVDVAGLDKQMVALMHKQQQLQAALDRKEDLCQRLSQVCSEPVQSVLELWHKQWLSCSLSAAQASMGSRYSAVRDLMLMRY